MKIRINNSSSGELLDEKTFNSTEGRDAFIFNYIKDLLPCDLKALDTNTLRISNEHGMRSITFSGEPTSNEPTSNEPTVTGPTSSKPTVTGPTSNEPTSNEPTVTGPTVTGPTVTGPANTSSFSR